MEIEPTRPGPEGLLCGSLVLGSRAKLLSTGNYRDRPAGQVEEVGDPVQLTGNCAHRRLFLWV
jgi:hypothetical protein